MEKYFNSKGEEIFYLDDQGNLWLRGNLNLGASGKLTAATIEAINNDDMAIIRDPQKMQTPYTGETSVIYYLGESTEDYTYGSWWSKYILGYDCFTNTDLVTEDEFINYERTFRVDSSEDYKHNKEILDAYPTTSKIIIAVIKASEDEEHNHWEIAYYDNDDELLYNDIIHSNLLYNSGYYFPFSPLNADDYNDGEGIITIDVTTVFALKEINPLDWSEYMPLVGGTFTGIINTENIAPNASDTYIIGTSDGRYKAGYFKEIVADVIKAKSLEIEEVEIESFVLTENKAKVDSGDTLVIADSKDNGSTKKAVGISFTGDTTKYLRQDGTFAIPKVGVIQTESFEDVDKTKGLIVQYIGDNNSIYSSDTVYLGTDSTYNCQIKIDGVEYSNVVNAAIVPINELNTINGVLNKINSLGIGTIEEYLEEQGYVTIIYSDKYQGWYLEGQEDKGIVPSSAFYNIDEVVLLNELVQNNSYYSITRTTESQIKVTISKFIWEPVNPIKFDGHSKDKFLTKAGTWEQVNIEHNTENKSIKGEIENIGEASMVISGLNNQTTSGIYDFYSATSGKMLSKISITENESYVIQTIYDILETEISDDTVSAFIPVKIHRKGKRLTTTVNISWDNWICDYEKQDYNRVSVDAPGTWRLMTIDDISAILISENRLKTVATINSVQGVIIFYDGFTRDHVATLPISNRVILDKTDPASNVIPLDDWDVLKNYSVFIPKTGIIYQGEYRNAVSTIDCVYWSSAREDGEAVTWDTKFGGGYAKSTHDIGERLPVRLIRENPNGKFTIGNGVKADISSSNLQYNAVLNIFRFAKNAYDIIGENNLNASSNYDGWIDLFTWGSSGYIHPPYTEDTSDITEEVFGRAVTEGFDTIPELDWAYYNPIYTVIPATKQQALLFN